jgi:hypothetical protein
VQAAEATEASPDQPIPTVPARIPEAEDVCPVCLEPLLDASGTQSRLTHCSTSCGAPLHAACLAELADYQASNGPLGPASPVKCPLCRASMGTARALVATLASSSRSTLPSLDPLHRGATCGGCRTAPIHGRCYHCRVCAAFTLCHTCFADRQLHTEHPFSVRTSPTDPLRPCVRPLAPPPPLPARVLADLQSRDLSDADYETLLRLDDAPARQAVPAPPPSDAAPPAAAATDGGSGALNSAVLQQIAFSYPAQRAAVSSIHPPPCLICQQPLQRTDTVRRLACQHTFHVACIDRKLLFAGLLCPVDGQHVSLRPLDSRSAHPVTVSSRLTQQGALTTASGRAALSAAYSAMVAPLSLAGSRLSDLSSAAAEHPSATPSPHLRTVQTLRRNPPRPHQLLPLIGTSACAAPSMSGAVVSAAAEAPRIARPRPQTLRKRDQPARQGSLLPLIQGQRAATDGLVATGSGVS